MTSKMAGEEGCLKSDIVKRLREFVDIERERGNMNPGNCVDVI